ncbi:MAG TPA: hypothetical protein VFO38_00035, partial [Candidatus Saccharimonadales bacterium]|nr:hypothetical protein [Candidatus Saccharimonadales bacterium]
VLVRMGGMRGIINFAGATARGDEAARRQMFWYFQSVFGGNPDMPFATAPFGAMSGGTRVLEEGVNSADPTGIMTIVEVPGLIHQLNPLVRTAGHAPRTAETLGYEGDHSSFSLAEDADSTTIANPDIHFLWLVQKNASDTSGWDGDVQLYLDAMELVRDSGEGEAAQFVWSGGGVTANEIEGALERGIPLFLPRGSGRIVDGTINALEGKWNHVTENRERIEQMLSNPKIESNLDCITVEESTQPRRAQVWLEEHNFAA